MWATSDFAPRSEAEGIPQAAGLRSHLAHKWATSLFEQPGIEWKVIEERIIAVVSYGAGTMGAYVGLLNAIREDAALCLMRAISTAKGKVIWCPFWPASIGPAPSECGGCGARGGSFISPVALVCARWKPCSTS